MYIGRVKFIFLCVLLVLTFINYQEKFNKYDKVGFYIVKEDIYDFASGSLIMYTKQEVNKLNKGQVVFYIDRKGYKNIAKLKNFYPSRPSGVVMLDREADKKVDVNKIYGVYLFNIAYLGNIIDYLRNVWVLFGMILLPLVAIILNEIDYLLNKVKEKLELILPVVSYKWFRVKYKVYKRNPSEQLSLLKKIKG